MPGIVARTIAISVTICLLSACGKGGAIAPEKVSGEGEQALSGPTRDLAQKAPVREAKSELRMRSEAEQLKLATRAVFPDGRAERVSADGEVIAYKVGKLIWAPFGPVLIASGSNTNVSAMSFGVLGVYYLKEQGSKFVVEKAWPEAIDGSIMGNAPEWEVSAEFGDLPVIISKSGGVWQGVACQTTAIHELYKDVGPGLLASFQSLVDQSGSRLREPAVSVKGKIENIVKGKSFDVRFTGTQDYVAHFEKKFDGYDRTDQGPDFPAC
jgi:hypothetical protein